ncbi:MAG: hypothetical protein IJC70_05170 [Firmicutes bacterium]|nr:hypothetical protein [Bacillota bacterium]
MNSFDEKKRELIQQIETKVLRYIGKTVEEATEEQLYQAVASRVRDDIMNNWMTARRARARDGAKGSITFRSNTSLAAHW